MKAAVVLAAAAAGFAAAQDLGGIPTCATSCLGSAIVAAGCNPTDVACQCGPTQTAIGTLVAPCLLTACPLSDVLAASSAGVAKCSAYLATASATATGTATTGSSTSTSFATTGPTVTVPSTSATSSTPFVTTTTALGTGGGGSGFNGTGSTSSKLPVPTTTINTVSGNLAATPSMAGAVGLVAAVLGAALAL